MTTNTWNESEAESVQVTILWTKTMTKIANKIGAPVVGVLGNCEKETWTRNWNKLGIDLFSLQCFHTIRDGGTFSLFFHTLCFIFYIHFFYHFIFNCARAGNEISKKLFPWVASCGLCWKKMYKLKRSIWMEMIASVSPANLIFLSCTCVYIAFNSYVGTRT